MADNTNQPFEDRKVQPINRVHGIHRTARAEHAKVQAKKIERAATTVPVVKNPPTPPAR